MAIHTTLDALIERVLSEEERKFDLLADTRRMSVREIDMTDEDRDGDEVLLTVDHPSGIEVLNMSDHALGQMATDLGIPKRYFDRMKVDAPWLFFNERPSLALRGAEPTHDPRHRDNDGSTPSGSGELALRPLPAARQRRDRERSSCRSSTARHRRSPSTTRRSRTRSSTSVPCSPGWRGGQGR